MTQPSTVESVMPKGTRQKTPEPTLEEALARLEEINQRLEEGDLELGESLALYEEGVRLLRGAEGALAAAETRVQQLRAEGDSFRLDPVPERP
jgi:exodeoxyribonuclease VII small subunit